MKTKHYYKNTKLFGMEFKTKSMVVKKNYGKDYMEIKFSSDDDLDD